MFGQNKVMNVTGGGYLNNVDDPAVGGANAVAGYPGQLGEIVFLTHAQAAVISKTNTLFGGFYQYVQFKAGSTASNARGQLVFWDTNANSGLTSYVVTPDATATNITQVAGVTLNAVTKGNYGWIQISGLASVKYAAAVTSAAIGNIVFVDVTPTNTVDANTEAAITVRQLAKKIGIAYELPVAGSVLKVQLTGLFLNV